VLAVLGARRAHLHDFPLFLLAVLAVAAVATAVFVVTAKGHEGVERANDGGPAVDP
jgi:hypothetical protein